jgi:hypothetical protein
MSDRKRIFFHILLLVILISYIFVIELLYNPGVKIVDYGPRKGFSVSGNEEASPPLLVWFQLSGSISEKTVIVFNNEELDTTVDFENIVVTASVPDQLRKIPGEYKLFVKDVLSGSRTTQVSLELLEPFLKINKYGPESIEIPRDMNERQIGQTAVWFSYEGTVSPATRVYWLDRELDTAVNEKEGIISATIPEDLLVEGSFLLKLADFETNLFSNEVMIKVIYH